MSKSNTPPAQDSYPSLTADTVLLIGNGIHRVPSYISGAPYESPSWSTYMDQLWNLVDIALERKASELLSKDAFARLSAPRQAQWFDEHFTHPQLKDGHEDAVALRLHLLAVQVHPRDGVLTNPLLKLIGRLVAHAATQRPEGVDLVTTNLDCALEQNIADAIDTWCSSQPDAPAVSIQVMSRLRNSVTWVRAGSSARHPIVIRLWKIHGCLRDLHTGTLEDRKVRVMQAAPMRDDRSGEDPKFGARTPREWLAPTLSHWEPRGAGHGSAIFSQREYFENLALLAHIHRTRTSDPSPELAEDHGNFLKMEDFLNQRPLFITGYSLTEGDVDVVFLLHTMSGPRGKRWVMLEKRSASADERARLKQMNIETYEFEVPSTGFTSMPAKMRLTSRQEWRQKNPEDWTKELQRVSANAWLEPQRQRLADLIDTLTGSKKAKAPSPDRTRRLAVAGLGSIWHAFSLEAASDFPARRRVSSALTSVDAQVPGGSGLVPIMQAAAMAGPLAAGRMAFFSNVPRGWKSWLEIEEFCLSAGIDVRPFQSADAYQDQRQSGRTSYVLLFDHEGKDNLTLEPRQRFIMDVNSIADETLANEVLRPQKPKACFPVDFEATEEDLLFADKETDPVGLREWVGPVIFETGASGDELARDYCDLRPNIWTSGVGSLLRTVVEIERCFYRDRTDSHAHDKIAFPSNLDDVLKTLERSAVIARLISCGGIGEDREVQRVRLRYAAKMVSFGQDTWVHGIDEDNRHTYKEEGFLYQDELDYGRWLCREWWDLGVLALDLIIGKNLLRDLEKQPSPLGRGILTTIHAGGLMAAWEFNDGSRQLIRVQIGQNDPAQRRLNPDVISETVANRHTFLCETKALGVDGREGSVEALTANIRIVTHQTVTLQKDQKKKVERSSYLEIECAGKTFRTPLGPDSRWNTLAAGDTVRGAMAYGLWAYAHENDPHPHIPKPQDISHVLLASAVLATTKCYAGSFVDFLRLLQELRTAPIWSALWGTSPAAEPEGKAAAPQTVHS